MSQPQTISADKLSALTGLSDRRHRQLADDGFFPKPDGGQYLLTPTISGMFRYFRESHTRQKFPVFESMAQAAGALKCPESLLKAAKRAGCKAFLTGGRIDCDELIPFIINMILKGDNLPDGFSSWKEFRERNLALIAEATMKKITKQMLEVSDAQRQAGEAMVLVFAELERRDRELPPALAGLPAVEIFKRMNADTEAIRRNLKTKFEEVGK